MSKPKPARWVWVPKKPKKPPRQSVSTDVREAVDALAAVVVSDLKKRLRKPRKDTPFNWADDVLTRWHRDTLYFVVVMRTPHGHPPTFETHAAKMEHVGRGRFNVAIPMRRGWNTLQRRASPEECLNRISDTFWY